MTTFNGYQMAPLTKAACSMIVFVCLLGSGARALEPEPIGLQAYVEAVLKDLAASDLKLTVFQDAEVDMVEPHDTPTGIRRYTCWLKNANGRAGYVAVAQTNGGFRVVSVSASSLSPEAFLAELALDGLAKEKPDWAKARLRQFAKGVPLVAAGTGKMPGGQSFDLPDLACTLAAQFLYLQYAQDVPLIGQDFLHVPRRVPFPTVFKNFHKARVISSDDYRNTRVAAEARGWRPVDEDVRNTRVAKRLVLRAGTAEKVKAIDCGMAVVRCHLTDPAIRLELSECLLAEDRMIATLEPTMANGGVLSAGGRASFLLARYYLGDYGTAAAVSEFVGTFLRSRQVAGTVALGLVPGTTNGQDAPFVVLPKDLRKGLAGLCVGKGAGSSDFALVFCPATGAAKSWTFTEKLRALGKKSVDPPAIKELNDRLLANEDTPNEWPSCLSAGVHIVPSCVLNGWSALCLNGCTSALGNR